MEIVLNIITLLMGGAACAGFTLYIRSAMEPGMIFGGWLPWVAGHLLRETSYLREALEACQTKEDVRDVLLEFASRQAPLIKPLGLCINCMLPWVAAPYFALMWFALPWALPWWLGFLLFLSFAVAVLRPMLAAGK